MKRWARGFPWLKGRQKALVRLGNDLVDFTAKLLDLQLRRSATAMALLEHPEAPITRRLVEACPRLPLLAG